MKSPSSTRVSAPHRAVWALAGAVMLIATLVVSAPVPASGAPGPDVTVFLVVKADSPAAAQAAAAKIHGELIGEQVPGRNLYRIRAGLDPKIKPKEFSKKLAELAEKASSEKGIAWAVPAGSLVDDTRFYAWRFYAWPEGDLAHDTDGESLEDLLDLPTVHRRATGAGVTVAVLDTGFDVDHPMLADRLLPGADLIDGDTDVGEEPNGVDDDGDGAIDEAAGHGTFVAGIVAQVAPDASILPIRVLEADGVGELYAVIEGIDHAVANGADVINLSFGMQAMSKPLIEAIKRAEKAGSVVVAAAGNGGSKAEQYPAAAKEVLGVTAYDRSTSSIARFGSRGKWVDVSAPGVAIASATPGGGMGTWSGSSLAAPVVAGQLALVFELDPVRASKEIRKAVRQSTHKARKGVESDVPLIDIGKALDRVS